MKKSAIILFFVLFILNTISVTLFADEVQGQLSIVDGKKILKIWGSHQQRGYAYGYLLGEEIQTMAFDYLLASYFYNNQNIYNIAIDYVTNHFTIEDKYQTEMDAIINGMNDAGVDLYSEILQRNLCSDDLLLCNSITDLAGYLSAYGLEPMGCSSISSWGSSTEADPQLHGDLVITRNLDWSTSSILQSNHLLVVNFPFEEDEQPWIAIEFPGLIGALSAMNNAGTAAFLNVGNINNSGSTDVFHPIFLSIRNGLETVDYNQDLITDYNDVFSAIDNCNHLSASIIHCVTNPSAIVIEVNNQNGAIVRDQSDNQLITGDNLVATNHFRILYEPVYCNRYQAFADSLSENNAVSIARSWQIAAGAGGVISNLQTIEFLPSIDILKWSGTMGGIPAYAREPSVLELSDLYDLPVESEPEQLIPCSSGINVYPNPAANTVYFSYDSNKRNGLHGKVYNIRGQYISEVVFESKGTYFWNGEDTFGRKAKSGIYLIKMFDEGVCVDSNKFVLVK